MQTRSDVLEEVGFGAYQAVRAARVFRRQDELHLRELAPLRNDQKAHVNLARQRIADMEEILSHSRKRSGDSDDTAWDTSTIREELGTEEV